MTTPQPVTTTIDHRTIRHIVKEIGIRNTKLVLATLKGSEVRRFWDKMETLRPAEQEAARVDFEAIKKRYDRLFDLLDHNKTSEDAHRSV